MTKTPIANDTDASLVEPQGTFWVNVILPGLGVVPVEALNCETFNDVLVLLHREDPNDQYFDGFSESRQAMRLYRRGIAGIGERQATVTANLIKGLKTHQ